MSAQAAEDWLQKLAALPTTRSCAGCELCCTIMGVEELGKAAWTACAHLGAEGGCAIWGAHPAVCRSFTCLWRRSDDLLPPDLFPADCGFILALDQLETWPTVVKVCAQADRPDAWDTPRNREIFLRLAASWNCPVVVIEGGVRGVLAFAPSGRIFDRADHPDVFPLEGRGLTVPAEDFDPDRRPPAQRIAEAAFSWRA